MSRAAAAVLVAGLATGCGLVDRPDGHVEIADLNADAEPLRADFRADSGRVRALVIGGPT